MTVNSLLPASLTFKSIYVIISIGVTRGCCYCCCCFRCFAFRMSLPCNQLISHIIWSTEMRFRFSSIYSSHLLRFWLVMILVLPLQWKSFIGNKCLSIRSICRVAFHHIVCVCVYAGILIVEHL